MNTTNTSEYKPLEVALLIEDMVQVKKITNVFREIGIIPHFYQDVRDFWNGVLKLTPAISIIDVKMMSGDGLNILHHPLVKNGKMPLSFYYDEKTKPLLLSTFKTFHFGLISSALPMKGQVKSVLTRLNEYFELQNEVYHSQNNLSNLEEKVGSLVEGYQNEKESSFYFQYFSELTNKFEQSGANKSFHETCESVLNQIEDVKEFGIYELDEKSQRLNTPHLLGGKFHKLPSLWLGQKSEEGIEFFAQNQASQVALDLLGGNIVTLYIYGARANPEKIIYITSDNEDFLNKFHWNMLERYISGFYAKKSLAQSFLQEELKKPLMSPWEFFGFINEERITNGGARFALVDLDFSILVDTVSSQTKDLFHWKNLFREFVNSLSTKSRIDFTVSAVGPRNLCFIVKENLADDFFQMLKLFSGRYPYWRYFEDTESYFTVNLKPRVQMIPFSTKAYIDYIDTFAVEDKLGLNNKKSEAYIHQVNSLPPSMQI